MYMYVLYVYIHCKWKNICITHTLAVEILKRNDERKNTCTIETLSVRAVLNSTRSMTKQLYREPSIVNTAKQATMHNHVHE